MFTYVEGADDNLVVKHARDRGLAVIDIRLNRNTPEWDNFELYYTEAFEQIAAFAEGRPMRLVNSEVRPR